MHGPHKAFSLFLITVVGIKALSYTINDPCKEILYIPTSRDIKFKAKSWIDVIGNKSAKTTGALITSLFGNSSALLLYGSVISLGIIFLWIPIAFLLGIKTQNLLPPTKILNNPCNQLLPNFLTDSVLSCSLFAW